ncbi:hypothetical protein JCM17823_14600 [Halorubrum gandharaense]
MSKSSTSGASSRITSDRRHRTDTDEELANAIAYAVLLREPKVDPMCPTCLGVYNDPVTLRRGALEHSPVVADGKRLIIRHREDEKEGLCPQCNSRSEGGPLPQLTTSEFEELVGALLGGLGVHGSRISSAKGTAHEMKIDGEADREILADILADLAAADHVELYQD